MISFWVALVLLLVSLGAGLVMGLWLARSSLSSQLNELQQQLREREARLGQYEWELRQALQDKARLEQQAQQVSDLLAQNQRLQTQAAELQSQIAALRTEKEADREKLRWVETAQQQLQATFEALASRALDRNVEQFLRAAEERLSTLREQLQGGLNSHKESLLGTIQPLQQSLKLLEEHMRQLEQKREGAYRALEQQISQLVQLQRHLQDSTTKLQEALRNPQVRGTWGEVQLRNLIELAGLKQHVDFLEQVSLGDGRPDLVVLLPDGGYLPIDAKAPMNSYLEAFSKSDSKERVQILQQHVRELKIHIDKLSQRDYLKGLTLGGSAKVLRAPDFVVLFLPHEGLLSTALEYMPNLYEYAFEKRIILTTPSTLLALLKAVAFGWLRQNYAENIREIAKEGKELYERLSTFAKHLEGLGKAINVAVTRYNETVSSYERRLLPAGRRFEALSSKSEKLASLPPIEESARSLSVSSKEETE